MVASVEQRLLLWKKGRRTPTYALEYSKIGGQYFSMPTVEKSPNNRVPTLCVACSWPAHHESDLWARRHETTNVNPPMEPRVRALHPRLLPESSISSPTAGCNPRGEVDSIDSSLPSQPQETQATALPSPPNAASSACLIFGFPERPSAQEHALSHDLRLKIASRTLAITRCTVNAPPAPQCVPRHVSGVTGQIIKGRYGRPTLFRPVPGNDANDSDVYDSSEEEGLEEAEADFLVSNVLKRSGMCDDSEASGVQLCSLALGGALVSLVLVMFIYYLTTVSLISSVIVQAENSARKGDTTLLDTVLAMFTNHELTVGRATVGLED